MVEVGANLFQFKFNSQFDMNKFLKGGPWTFDNQVLLLVRWKPRMTAGNVRFETASFWVQIWGGRLTWFLRQLPRQWVNGQVL